VAGLAGAVVGNAAGSDGSSVTVTGPGSDWRIGGSLIVGNVATGELNLSNGGSVTATTLDAGSQASGAGIISISGTNTNLTTTGTFSVGDAGAGELSALGAGNLTIGTDLDIGTVAGGTGNVDIENTGGTVFIGGNLNVGTDGYGELTIGPNVNVYLDNGIENFGLNASVVQFSFIDPSPALNNTSSDYQLKISGADPYSAYVNNSGGIEITSGHSVAFETPIIYGSGSFTIDDNAELVLNADTVIGQAINFGSNSTLVIGEDVLSTVDTPPSGSSFTSGPNPNKGSVLIDNGFRDDVLKNFSASDTIIVDTTQAAQVAYTAGDSFIDVVQTGDPTHVLGTLTFDNSTNAGDAYSASDVSVLETVLCFLPGTLLATPSGQTAVERLKVGDQVLTAGGEARPVVWLGVGRVLATRGRRNAATPVIVRKGALGPNVPHEDLRVTKGHSFLLDGVLIPVEFLVNHRSILWDDRAQEVSVYHVELETHDVLLANGAAAESYRDDGNRWLFQNANAGWDQPPKPPCAPVLTGGVVVDRMWRRLLDACGPRPGVPLTDDPDLHLIVDEVRMDALAPVDGVYVFDLGSMPKKVRIVSRAAVPQELGVARDARCLGVAVRRIAVRRGSRFRVLLAGDASLVDGFHRFEADRGLRWTDGDAVVPAGLFAGFSGRGELMVHVGAATRYMEEDTAMRLGGKDVPAIGRRAVA
jgi:T5SS/PEP-CTERM-associated repeat protein